MFPQMRAENVNEVNNDQINEAPRRGLEIVAGDYFVWNSGIAGFGAQVNASGYKSDFVHYRAGGGRALRKTVYACSFFAYSTHSQKFSKAANRFKSARVLHRISDVESRNYSSSSNNRYEAIASRSLSGSWPMF